MSQNIKFPKDNPEESLGFLYWQASNLWRRKINAALKPLDLTHVQFILLAGIARLEKSDAPTTQIQLANHAKTDIMMTSRVLRTLEEKGLVQRSQHEQDTRAKSLSLTRKGVDILDEAVEIVGKADIGFFSVLGSEFKDFQNKLVNLVHSNQIINEERPR